MARVRGDCESGMNDADFQLRFEDFMNDYDYKLSQDIPVAPTLRKMKALIDAYLEARDRAMYENKNLQNGAD